MSWLERFRQFVLRTEERANTLEYSVLDELHDAEDAIDERTGGRFYDTREDLDERSEHLLERLGLDEEDDAVADDGEPAPDPKP